jgi:hypothetical protein
VKTAKGSSTSGVLGGSPSSASLLSTSSLEKVTPLAGSGPTGQVGQSYGGGSIIPFLPWIDGVAGSRDSSDLGKIRTTRQCLDCFFGELDHILWV